MIRKMYKRDGFTFLEILTVLAVLGILISLAIPRITNLSSKTRDAQIHTVAATIKKAMAYYYVENDGRYPDSSLAAGSSSFKKWNELFGQDGLLTIIHLQVSDLNELKEKYNVKDFQYESDGSSFSMSFTSNSTGRTYTLTETGYQ